MEFDEMKKIWDSQNNEPLYVINEKALHNRILSKKKRAGHVANFSELLTIFVNIGAGLFVLGATLYTKSSNIPMYLMAAWMFITALYILVVRIRRTKGEHGFERSMLDDLNHAISNATYQVRLSQLMRWNILPIAIFIFFSFLESGKPAWIATLILIFFALIYYAAGWEHRIYKARKHELEVLQKKLQDDGIHSDPF